MGPANLDDADLPDDSHESQRAPLTGRIQSRSSSAPLNQSYLTSSIPGEDRRAPANTIDESVWDTLSRDLLAVWEKLRQVLWPKYLLGGVLQRGEGMVGQGREGLRGIWRIGRWPDAEGILQGGMSEGLRDWDLWYLPLDGSVALSRRADWVSFFSFFFFKKKRQGTAGVLLTSFISAIHDGAEGAENARLFRRFHHDLGR